MTGASRGIGRAIARALAADGYRVLANWARSEDAARSLAAEITAAGGACTLVRANVGSPVGLAALVEAARAANRLDVLVHNAALGTFKPVLQVRPNQWQLTMSINVQALLELARGLADLLAASGGVVVSLTSHGGRRVLPNYGAVGVSKAALESLTRYLAAELAPRGVRVNALCAGWVDTDAVRAFPNHGELRAWVEQRVPMGRVAEPGDIADVVRLLVRPEARWITGQVIVADGGESLW
ncbi:MAG TPA: SDR family oxidoreductase [Candidatus Binatia bacterium]|nr:SDR family oxidoreductase [Candidatus Binatia bacterium]